ncbi:MAG: hypothetical protein IT233_09155 [Bacteroidia bacterium]|nr:hypothetical protein [Bacteroidia bacterium]
MAKIIREDFTPDDFKQIVEQFLFTDTQISMPLEKLNLMKERLLKAGPSFQKTFHAYFEFTDNTRYDRLCSREESFIKKLLKYNEDMSGEEKTMFNLFWKHIAEMIETDYMQMNDQYLKNSCRYFVWEISKFS